MYLFKLHSVKKNLTIQTCPIKGSVLWNALVGQFAVSFLARKGMYNNISPFAFNRLSLDAAWAIQGANSSGRARQMVRITRLEVVHVLVDEGPLSREAEKLHIKRPTLSGNRTGGPSCSETRTLTIITIIHIVSVTVAGTRGQFSKVLNCRQSLGGSNSRTF